MVQVQREPNFRGIYISGSNGEEKPSRTLQRKVDREQVALEVVETQRESDFIGSQWIQREYEFRGRQENQRESVFKGS
jgi:hypothetical protein